MATKKTGAASVAPEDRFYRVQLARSVQFQGVHLNPRDTLVVNGAVLVDLGDNVLASVEVDADGKEV